MKTVRLTIDLDRPGQTPSRDGFGHALVEEGRRDPQLVVLGADISSSVRVDWFRDQFPDRFYSVGIAEQNLINIAAGLSLTGKVPFVSTYGVFLSGRAWDQIRTTVCYGQLNVKLGGAHGGISVGPDGATHQALEEIAIMRCLPHMTVVVPADAEETRKATLAVARMQGPAYVRFGREKVPDITVPETPFELGSGYCLRDGSDVAIVACGAMVFQALLAARTLTTTGIDAAVINLHTIKPIDEALILEAARKTGALVTAEEHQKMGGMGCAVLEVLARHHPVPVEMVGVNDTFGESGQPDELMSAYGLDAATIVAAARQVVERKKS